MSADTDLRAPQTAAPDAALIAPILAGQPAAFERLMRQHNRRLFRAARAILRDDAEAEDALQEGYLSAYQALPGFRGQSALATWLTRIVVNKALERLRRRAPAEGWPEDAEAREELRATPADTPEAQAMRRELRRMIESAIDRLPDGCRAVFMLRAVEELDVAETAACLGMSEAAVKTALFRARAQLRDAIGREIGSTIDDFFAFDGVRCDRIVASVMCRLAIATTPSRAPPD